MASWFERQIASFLQQKGLTAQEAAELAAMPQVQSIATAKIKGESIPKDFANLGAADLKRLRTTASDNGISFGQAVQSRFFGKAYPGEARYASGKGTAGVGGLMANMQPTSRAATVQDPIAQAAQQPNPGGFGLHAPQVSVQDLGNTPPTDSWFYDPPKPAASFVDPRTNPSVTPGVFDLQGGRGPATARNNNPGAISNSLRYGGEKGSARPRAEGGWYTKFATPEHGINAAAQLLRKNYDGLTLQQIVNKWAAAPGPNYAKTLGDALGIGVNDIPNLADDAVVARLLEAQSTHESGFGKPIYTPDTWQRGVRGEFPGTLGKPEMVSALPPGASGVTPIAADSFAPATPQAAPPLPTRNPLGNRSPMVASGEAWGMDSPSFWKAPQFAQANINPGITATGSATAMADNRVGATASLDDPLGIRAITGTPRINPSATGTVSLNPFSATAGMPAVRPGAVGTANFGPLSVTGQTGVASPPPVQFGGRPSVPPQLAGLVGRSPIPQQMNMSPVPPGALSTKLPPLRGFSTVQAPNAPMFQGGLGMNPMTAATAQRANPVGGFGPGVYRPANPSFGMTPGGTPTFRGRTSSLLNESFGLSPTASMQKQDFAKSLSNAASVLTGNLSNLMAAQERTRSPSVGGIAGLRLRNTALRPLAPQTPIRRPPMPTMPFYQQY